jgi:hypothetical protein
VWIRIRICGSMPLTNGSPIFVMAFKIPPKKLFLKRVFLLITFTSFFKVKSPKEVAKQ